MIRLRIQIEPNKPVLEEGYTLFPGWYHLVVVGKSGSMADFSFLKKKWQNSLDLLTEKVA